MAITLPSAVPSMGTRRVVFIPGPVADIDAITVAEVTSGKNISCYLTRSGGWNAGGDQATITDSRYCSAQDFEIPGSKTRTLALQYTINLNEPTEDEARIALTEGVEGTLVHLMQLDEESETFAASDFYEAVPVRMGEPMLVNVEDNAVDRVNQKAFIRGPWRSFKQLVAGA